MPILIQHAVIVITRQPGNAGVQVNVHGDLPAHMTDLGLDEAKRQLGTYEETPLDVLLRESGLELNVIRARDDGPIRVSLNASLRDPKSRGGLLLAEACGATPAEARRNLAEKITLGTLVFASGLPISREIPVGDLSAERYVPEEEDLEEDECSSRKLPTGS